MAKGAVKLSFVAPYQCLETGTIKDIATPSEAHATTNKTHSGSLFASASFFCEPATTEGHPRAFFEVPGRPSRTRPPYQTRTTLSFFVILFTSTRHIFVLQ